MTIAVGFKCSDGILLGADSQIENLDVKYEDDKVFYCTDQSAEQEYCVLLTGSGDSTSIKNIADYAQGSGYFDSANTSMKDLKFLIRNLSKTSVYLDSVKEAKEAKSPIELLWGLKSRDRHTDIVYQNGARTNPIKTFECVGSGSSTARYFSNWLYVSGVGVHIFAPLAVQIIKTAKQHNIGCDGDTKFHKLFSGDTPKDETDQYVTDNEFLWGLHARLRDVVYCCLNPQIHDAEFEGTLASFITKSKELRKEVLRNDELMKALGGKGKP
jgi:hypothetical protein